MSPPSKPLKILHAVEFYSPSLGGSQEVIKRLSEGMVALGHDVTVATSFLENREKLTINGVKIVDFKISGNMADGLNGDVEKYREYLLKSDFDVVLFYAAQQWTFDAALPILNEIRGKKVFVPCGFSGLQWPMFKDYFEELPRYLKAFDHLVFLSDDYRDINFCRAHGFTNISIIPNGCAYEEFAPIPSESDETRLRKKLGIPENDFLVLHVGTHTGIKGHKEAIEMFNQANIPNATFAIVGNHFSRRCVHHCRVSSYSSRIQRGLGMKKNKILSLQLSRKDTIGIYHAADLFLFPSNIECSPIVLFEAAAARTPFLTTDVGNSKEIIRWLGSGEIIKTNINAEGVSYAEIEDGTQKLKAWYESKSRRDQMGQIGRENWEKKFTWEKISKQYLDLYLGLVN